MIIFLYGEDTFRSREKLNELVSKFKSEVDSAGNSLHKIYSEDISLEKINEHVSAPSLFSRKRMIIIEGIFNQKDKTFFNESAVFFEKFLGKKSKKTDKDSDNIIVFWDEVKAGDVKANKLYKLLLGADFSQQFLLLTNTQVISWIKSRTESHGTQIRQQPAVQLASFFNSDLWRLNNEIKKLSAYKLSQQIQLPDGAAPAMIEAADIENLVRGSFDENIFALTDAISMKNKARALMLFEQELDNGVTESYLMHMVMRQFKILMQVRQGLDAGQTSRKIISQLKLHPFVVQKAISQVRNFSLNILKNIFIRLLMIDKKMKTGEGDLKTELNLLFASL